MVLRGTEWHRGRTSVLLLVKVLVWAAFLVPLYPRLKSCPQALRGGAGQVLRGCVQCPRSDPLNSLLVTCPKPHTSETFRFLRTSLPLSWFLLSACLSMTLSVASIIHLCPFSFYLNYSSGGYSAKLVFAKTYLLLSFVSGFTFYFFLSCCIPLPFNYFKILLLIYFKIFCNYCSDISWIFEFFRNAFLFQMY